MKKIYWQTIILINIFGLWFLITKLKVFSILLLPSPQAVLTAFLTIFIKEHIFNDLFYTLYRLLVGLFLGIILGLSLGLLISISKKLTQLLGFWLDFLRSMPVSALFPLFLLFFGLGDLSKILMVIFTSSLIITINTIYGITNANQTRIMSGRSMGLNKTKIFLHIILPESLPYLATGIRHAISYSLIIVIISEMFIGAENGLGKRINDFHLTYEIASMYATIMLAGFTGYFINKLYLIFETKTIHWTGK